MGGTMFGEGGQRAYDVYKMQRDIERDAIEDLKLRSQAQDDIQKGLIKELLFLPTVETEADKLARDRSTVDMEKIQNFWNPIKGQIGFSNEDIQQAVKSLSKEQREHFKQNPADAQKFFNDFLMNKIINKAPQKGAQYEQMPVESPMMGFNLESPGLGLNLIGMDNLMADRGPASIELSSPEQAQEMVNRGLSLPMGTSLPTSQSGHPFFNKAEQDILGKMIEAEIIRGKSMVGLAKQGMVDNTNLWESFWKGLNDTYGIQEKPKKGGGGAKNTLDEKLILKMFGMTKDELVALSGTDSRSKLKQARWLNIQQGAWALLKDPAEKERFRQAVLSVTLGSPEVRSQRANIFGKEAPGRAVTPAEKPQASNKQLLRDAAQQSKDLKSLMQKMLEENAKKNRK